MLRHATAGLGLIAILAAPAAPLPAQGADSAPAGTLAERIEAVMARPEFRHAVFGVEIYSLETGQPIYTHNGAELFVPGSTTKLVTEGTALALLGPDYRFHTRVYRTGPVTNGTLAGNLVLVASGDPNLSGRIQPDGALAFENEDHSYDGSPDTRAVPGDPLLVIHELARDVRAHGITRITGHVIIDVSLFPEGQRELGTGVVISPIAVNDNLVDVTVAPGRAPGDPVTMTISPATAYVHFINHATTGAPDSKPSIHWASDSANADGSHTVTVGGSMPATKPSILYSYAVPSPSRFAEVALVEALRAAGVQVSVSPFGARHDFKALAVAYVPANLVAEHVSPPFSQELKVTLKVSQNLHASMTPYILGAVVGHQRGDSDDVALKAGFALEHEFLSKAGLDLAGASQADGAGGSAHFSPDFMVHFLAAMATRPDFATYLAALPVLGRDGTLWNIQVHSPAAGHVHAKTGTYEDEDLLNNQVMVDGKGLAGYMTTADGRRLAFALYVNNVAVPHGTNDLDTVEEVVGQALGEIAAAAYETPP